MTSTTTTPQLLPGVSASTWRVILNVGYWVGIVAVVVPYATLVLSRQQSLLGLAIAIEVVVVALILVFSSLYNARTRKEAAAGYTTLWRSRAALPQLDRISGAVIRAAGHPYVAKAVGKNRADPASVKQSPEIAKPTVWQRILPFAPRSIATLLLICLGSWFLGATIPLFRGFDLVVAGTFLFAALMVVLIATAYNRRRLLRLRAAAGGDFAFIFGASREYWTEAVDLGWKVEMEGTYIPRGVSANSVGLTFWRGKPFERVARLPWAQVLTVQGCRVDGSSGTRPALVVTYRNDSGEIKAITLLNANADFAPLQTMPERRWIASQLNLLRPVHATKQVV